MRSPRGRLGRLARRTRRRARPLQHNGLSSYRYPLLPGGRGLLRGVLQRHPLAAVPRRDRHAGVPPGVVGRLRRRSTSGSPSGPPRSPVRARWSGCRTTSSSWCRRCCASCDRTCGSASSCTSPSRRPSSTISCPGATRSSKACWAPIWSGSSCPAARRTSSGWSGSGSTSRPGGTGSAPRTAATCSPARIPISIDGKSCTNWPHARGDQARGKQIRRDLGDPKVVVPRGGPAGLHQGHARADPRLRRTGGRGLDRPRGRGLRPGRHPVAGTGRPVPQLRDDIDRHGRPDQRRHRPAGPAADHLSAHLLSRGRRWPRSSARPTSWSSPRSATG